jgi:hypothetical protein
MSDVIRMGRTPTTTWRFFDKGKALALYHAKRPASPGNELCCTPMDVTVVHPTSVPG